MAAILQLIHLSILTDQVVGIYLLIIHRSPNLEIQIRSDPGFYAYFMYTECEA